MGIFHRTIFWHGRPFGNFTEINERSKMDNDKYKKVYNDWVSKLSPKERENLKAQGLDKPLEDKQNYSPDPEVVFDTTIGDEFDYDKLDGQPEEKSCDENSAMSKAMEYALETIRWSFMRLLANKNDKDLRLDMNSFFFANGLEFLLEVKTQTELAKKYGVTRASVSVRVKNWQKALGIKPSVFMKSESACKSYRKARIANLTKEQLL